MTVPVQDPINVSVANGVTVVFPYNFRILAAADLHVEVDGVTQTLNVNYTVSGVGNNGGGNVTFISGAPANGLKVLRQRLMDYERTDDFQNGGDIKAKEVNKNFDAAVMMIQQLAAAIGLSLQIPPEFIGIVSGILPPPESLKGLRWNAAANAIENYEITGFSAPGGSDLVGFIQVGAGSVARTSQSKQREWISPEDKGAVVGNSTPAVAAANTAAINACLRDAATFSLPVRFSRAEYYVDTSVTPVIFPSGITVHGNAATIRAINDNAPIAVSDSWMGINAPTGRLRVFDLLFRGTGAGASQHGFILRDFFSGMWRCRAIECGGDGFVGTHLDKNAVAVGGTLVENRWVECETSGCLGIDFNLGPAGNNKLTDGYLIDPVCNKAAGSTARHIFIGSGAGWKIDGVHTYGGTPDYSVLISNCFRTTLGSFYIEAGWTTGAMNIGIQRLCHLKRLVAVAGAGAVAANVSALRVARDAGVAAAEMTVDTIELDTGSGTALKFVHNVDPTIVTVRASKMVSRGTGAITPPARSDTWLIVPRIAFGFDSVVRKESNLTGGAQTTLTFTFDVPSSTARGGTLEVDVTAQSSQSSFNTHRVAAGKLLFSYNRKLGDTANAALASVAYKHETNAADLGIGTPLIATSAGTGTHTVTCTVVIDHTTVSVGYVQATARVLDGSTTLLNLA